MLTEAVTGGVMARMPIAAPGPDFFMTIPGNCQLSTTTPDMEQYLPGINLLLSGDRF
ncbi:MAG: hypothetical protein R2860_13580 [Desulfobacterales bacterium]